MSKHFSDLISARLQNVCSAKGATFAVSMGQRPNGAWHKKTPVLKARFKSKTSPLGETTSYTYDGSGNLLSVTDPLGAVTLSQCDALGRVTRQTDALALVNVNAA